MCGRTKLQSLTLAVALGFAALLCAERGATAGGTDDDERQYAEAVSHDYDFRFGANPFAPSNATTVTGTFLSGKDFIASSRCAKCHTDAHAQWLQSAHRNSFREPFYQKNVNDLIAQRGIAYTRHCEACHNPAALFSGALTKGSKLARPFDDDGVSCIVCHSIREATRRGVGGYVMGVPALLVREDGTQLLHLTDQQILDDVPSHRRAVMRPLLKAQEFCASCHKSQVPRELNDYKFMRAFSVGDEFQVSAFSKESPHPFYVRDRETCNSCHMKREAAPLFDVSARDGELASHRWAAANTAIPFFYGLTEQLALAKRSLEADAVGIDIFALRRNPQAGGAAEEIKDLIAPVNRSRFELKPGDTLTADVVVTNKNIGHSFPPELRDFYEAWVEFTVEDEGGRVLYASGFLKPNGYVDDSAHTYKTYLVKADGSFNDLHHIWKTRVAAQNNQIQSGRSDVARYRFTLPKDLKGALTLRARVAYRRFTRTFSDYTLGKSIDYPVVTMASAEVTLEAGENVLDTATKTPDWRRWNNYGVALLDQRQFATAAEVFAHVGELDETYRPWAETNRALALIELDRYGEAARLIGDVIGANPPQPALDRALFQQARVFLKLGRFAEAEENLRRVLSDYPSDRQSWRQLGELCKLKRDYAGARHCYEQILGIDPEDTGAHYNLIFIYRQLSLTQAAQREAAIFADLKDDQTTFAVANDFLRSRPEINNESVPFHIHDLNR